MNKYCNFIFKYLIVPIVFCCGIGCQSKAKLSNTVYFNQRKDSLLATIVKAYEPTIEPGDRLVITVTALDPQSVTPYNLNASNGLGNTGLGYLVEKDGNVRLPQLGKIMVKGYKLQQLVDTLTRRITLFVNDPVITVQFINFKITVIGEVNKPGVINISEGKVNMSEILGLAGDLTPYARRENIMIIREKDGIREFGTLNLLSINVFSSPYYNLQQNDIIYIEPTKAKATSSDQTLVRNLSIITSILSVISTVFFLVLNIAK